MFDFGSGEVDDGIDGCCLSHLRLLCAEAGLRRLSRAPTESSYPPTRRPAGQ
jgi:hypothetical protein